MSQLDVAKSAVQFTTMQNDVVMFQEFAHGPKSQAFMLGKDNIDAFVAGGGKNICLENGGKDENLQKFYDGFSQVGGLSNRRDQASPENQKKFDNAVDEAVQKYGEYMSDNYKRSGVENNSQAEVSAYKDEARSIIYAGSKGVRMHAIDSGLDSEKLANGVEDFTKVNQQDGPTADKIIEIAKTGKTGVIYGAAHSIRGGEGKDKDIEDSLVDKGVKVGRIGVVENMKDFERAVVGGTTMHGKHEAFKEVPNTIIQLDANKFFPGNQMQVMQMQTDGKNRELGGELDRDSKEAENSTYKKVSEKDLGNIAPPEIFANAPKAQIVER